MVGGGNGLGDVEGWGAEARGTEAERVRASGLGAGKLEASESEVSRSEVGRLGAGVSGATALRRKELDSPLSSLLPHSSASVIFNLIAQRAQSL